MMVTADQVREAAISAKVSSVDHFKCPCGSMWSYKVMDGHLHHNVPCKCVPNRAPGLRRVPWLEVSSSINVRPEGPEKVEMMKQWGFQIPENEAGSE